MSRSLRLLVVCAASCVAASAGYVGIAEPSLGAKAPTPRAAVAKHTRRTHRKPARPAHRGVRRRRHRHASPRGVQTRPKPARKASLSPTLAPGAQLLSGNQASPAGSAGTSSPSNVTAREQSATAYENLSSQAAEAIMQETYPAVVDNADGGPPPLAEGQKATGFPSDFAMSVDLGGGTHALVESEAPLALETEEGKHTPLDLSLHEVEGGFAPMFGLAPVRLPLQASEGAILTDTGVSLTPVTEQGAALGGGNGVRDHASVFYGNTENAAAGAQDLSMLAKPTTYGFEIFSTLFSARSPEHLYFKVGLPEGATLEQGRSGEVRVMKAGRAVSTVAAFSARDAEGTAVPVTTTIASGDMIELTVARKPGQYRYPLVVDPTMTDSTLLTYQNAAWVPASSSPSKYNDGEWGGVIELFPLGTYPGGEFVAWEYETQGKSKLYEFEAESGEVDLYSETETLLEAWAPSGTRQNWGLLTNNYNGEKGVTAICSIETTSCLPSQGADKNMFRYVKYTLAAGGGYGAFDDALYKARVWISQEESPTVTFNTTSPTIEIKEPNGTIVNRNNVLYPSNKEWVGPFTSTAFEMTAKDPGIGVSFAVADGNTWSRETFLMTTEKDCKGVQCPQEFKGKYTYFTTTPGFTSPMPSGEYSIQGRAEDPVALAGETHATVRVDALGPEAIKITNLPTGGQIGEGVYKIKAEATDGKTGEPSSGVASLKLGIDGAEAAEPKGSCAKGPCTATAEWTINGGQLSAGPHTLTVLATDNAGNVEHEDFVIFVHHATPTAVGPGSLDPQSGNYSLGGTDASMGPGLTVTRAYSSRNLTAGVEGSLGPQWAMSVGGSAESVEELPDGSMMLITANGGETVFARNSKGELESPEGDVNLTLSVEENEQKLPIAYKLKDSAAGTSTKFTRSTGYLQSTPVYYGQMGWQGPSTSQLVVPTGVTADIKGDVWVLDQKSSHIEKFNPQGEYVSQFGYESTGVGGFKQPDSIARDSKGNLWIADTGNNRIEEFTEGGSYLRKAGTEGTGTLKAPQGIATDASNNVWVTDTGDNRVVEFNETGGYLREAAKTVGTLALSEPIGVATDKSGDAWVTDAKNHRVVEFGPTGTALKEFGSSGSTNGKFETPTGLATDSEGNMWVADNVLNRLQEFNTKGEYLTQVGSTGINPGQLKKPDFVAIDGRGDLLVADTENARVGRWAHATWTPTTSEGPVASSAVTYTYKTVLVKGGTVTHPTEVVAPHASELSCAPTVNKGCRVLFLKYAETTTATGENESEWKDYEGRLKEVVFTAYNPATTKVEEKAIAQYAYDTQGRLRAEWDPRITPNLKMVYGYDSEGHVTSVLPPGQEPWLFHYGTIPTDTSAGRLLSATRPAAATEPGSRLAPKNTGLPTLSTSTPAVGVRISVSTNGTWSNTPLAYSYQWEDCNSSGGECAAIPGAVNEGYYPALSDEKRKLVALVTAVNAGGSTTVATTATGLVGAGTPNNPAPEPPNPGTAQLTTIEYAVPLSGTGLQSVTAAEVKKWGQEDDPVEGTAVFPPDTPMGWPAKEYKRATISYFDAEGRTVNNVNPSGGVSTTEYGPTNNVVRSLNADDRALALKEGEKSKEAAAKLDDRKIYNEEGDELVETLGPEHKLKLSNGTEVQARHRVRYSYDQNAPSEKTYRLVTETVESAVVAGKEQDQKVTQTHYFGQNGLGWTLRKPTSVTVDPYGLKLTTTTLYDAKSGVVIETGTTKGTHENEITERPLYSSTFGSYGTGNGQLREGCDLTTDSAGNVWVADWANSRLDEWNSKGEFVRTVGSHGTGNGQFEGAYGVAFDPKGKLWATDGGKNRIEEFSSEGVFEHAFGSSGSGNGQFNLPESIAVDSKGNVFVTDRGNNRVQELDSEGKYIRSITKPEDKEGPFGVAVDASGDVWVSYAWDYQIAEFSPEGTLIRSWGTRGTAAGQLEDAYRLTVGPEGDIWVAEWGNNRVQVFTPAGEYLYGLGSYGTGEGQFWHARGVSVRGSNVYVLDSGNWDVNSNNRIEKWHLEPHVAYSSTFGSYGTGNGQLREGCDLTTDSAGNVWVADWANSRLDEWNSKGEFVRTVGSHGTGNGQFEGAYGVAFDPKGKLWATDGGKNRIEEFSSEGVFEHAFGSSGSGNGQFNLPESIAVDSKGNVFVTDRGNNRVQELDSEGKYIRSITKPEDKEGPFGVAVDASGDVWVSYAWDYQIAEFSPEGTLIRSWGTRGTAAGQLEDAYRLTVGPEGDIWVAEWGNNRVQVFTPAGEYLYGLGSYGTGEGQFWHARGVSVRGSNVYVLDSGNWDVNSNNRIEKWTLNQELTNTGNAHDHQVIYFSGAANSTYPACGGHVEWEGMPCKTLPGAQPEGSAPPLPVITTAGYNMWGEPETTEETFGATTRTKKTAYDEGGRPLSTEETSTAGTALPKVTDGYSETTGQLTKQSTSVGEETQTITSVFDRLGRVTNYTDADKKTTTYEYELSGAGRLLTVTDEKGSQSYSYDATTGQLTKLLDSAANTFTASYDVEGHMTSETYPNGMTANYTQDQAGEPVGIEYVKTTRCTEKCVWFSETITPAINGEALSRSNTLTNDTYSYDAAGRLTQTSETPAGKGCSVRVYAYDEESNRTGLTSREPGVEGKCATEGGITETHSYDAGNRLTDAGVTYDPFGDTTKLPAADAGGHELTTEYYVDGQALKQVQNGQTNTYSIDPAGRVRKTVGEGATNLTTISHFAGGGEALTWRDEGEGKYTRMIPGIDGSLSATQANGGTPILEIHDLQGDVVGTAALSETETKLLSAYNSTEFGVQVNGVPPTKLSWLGAEGVSSELSSGALIMGTVAYVPQLGRPLQTQAVIPPGMAINGAEGVPYIAQASAWSVQAGEAQAQGDSQNYEAELQKTAEREAEEKACAIASMCVTPEGEASEAYDPEGLASYAETLKRANELWKDAANSVFLSTAFLLIPDLGVYISGGVDGLAAQLKASSRSLAGCSEAKALKGRQWEWGVCFINETRIGYKGFSIPFSATAELCSYERTKHNVNEYDCLESKRKKVKAPWYKD
jgi:YD repeat-containing protein